MFTLAKVIIASSALIYGAAKVQPVDTTAVTAKPVATAFVFAPDNKTPDTFVRDGSDVEANVEQAQNTSITLLCKCLLSSAKNLTLC